MAKIDRAKLRREIQLKIGADNEVKVRTKAFALEVKQYWQKVAWPEAEGETLKAKFPDHPYSLGSYVNSIEIKRNRSLLSGRFMAGWTIYTNHPVANFIEFGTARDKPGSRSPWGPLTPTPDFAPAARTAHHFFGTAP